MKINVTENKVSIKEEQILNENEYNIHKIQFDFSSEYTDDLVKVALFSIDNHTYKKIISNNECDIPPEVLTQRGYSILGVYAYKTEQDTLVLRYSPSPTRISVYDGSYKADAENSEPITPSEIEQYQQILQNSLQQFQNQYNALVEETEGDIQAIENELQRKVDEGYFDGEDGYTPVRGVDYWTEEDKQEVKEEATQQIEGKIEEYNENAAEKLNQYNQNSVQKTNDYNINAEQKMSAYNTNATEKFNDYNSNAEQKETNYNTNASQKVESFNTNANSKLSEYNSNAETKKSAYDENATQKTTSFNTNATNKLTEYNTNHTEKMNAYNSNNTEKLNAFNENATQKTEDFDEHTEEIQDNIEILQRTDNQILSRFNKDEEVSGQDITLTGTTEIKFAKPPLPMGNSEQESTEGTNLIGLDTEQCKVDLSAGDKLTITNNTSEEIKIYLYSNYGDLEKNDWFSFAANSTRTITLLYDAKAIAWLNAINGIAWCNLGEIALPYEKYTGGTASPNPQFESPITNVTGDVEVKVQNKNLLPNNLIWQYGYVNGSGNWSGDYTHKNVFSDYIYLKAGIYTISYEIATIIISIAIYDKNKTFIERNQTIYTTTPAKNKTFTLNQDGYIRVSHYDNTGTQLLDNINSETNQLEIGSTSTDYVEHKEQTFTFPLGNEKLMLGDYLADDGIHHVRGQVVLDGSNDESWNHEELSYGNNFYINIPNAKGGNEIPILSNYFKYNENGRLEPDYSCRISTSKNLNLRHQDFTNISDFKTWLSTHNTIAEYSLLEEVIVPYTSAQQEVYNEIKNAYSYDEMTIITGSSDGNKPFFIVQAYKDLNKELNKNSNLVNGSNIGSLRSISSAIENETYTIGTGSFAVGKDTQASGEMSYAEGEGTKATGWTSHSEGTATEANGDGSHSEGYESKANGIYSHTEGFNTQADGYNQHVEGMNNIVDSNNKYAHIVGNGENEENRSNAHTIDWQGNGWFQGNVKVGGISQNDTNAQNLITEDKYNRLKATLPTTTGEGKEVTLNKTAELEFIKSPLPMGNSEQVPILPEGYTQLDYIEKSTNNLNAYIDAGFKPSNNTKVSMNATVSSLEGAGRFLFGTRNSARTDTFAGLIWTDNKASGGFGNSGIYQSESVQNIDTKFNLTLDKNLLYHNGVLIKTFDEQQFTSDNNLWIATLNNNGSTSQPLTGKIYSCKIWDNGILIRDYIPCKRNSDNKIGMYDIVNDTFNSSANNYSFTAGSEATTPNPDYPQEITNVTGDVEVKVQNKNLLNIGTLLGGSLSIAGLYLNGGYSYFNITDNKVTVTTTQNYRGFVSDYIEIKENTRYFLSFETLQTGLNFEKYYSFYDENKENGSRNQTGLSPANAKYMRVSGTISTATTADFYNIQVEEGSVATDYVEHKEQTFIFPLGNEKLMLGDYLADDGIHHVRGQVVLDGSENINWNINNLTTHYNFYAQVARNCKAKQLILCDHSSSNSFSDTLNNCYISASKNFNFNFSIDGVTTSNAFNDWLSTHNITVEYPLNEEVIVPYTSAQQEVYNQIKQALSYEEQTNISSNTIALFNVEAYQSTKLVLEERDAKYESLEARVALLE